MKEEFLHFLWQYKLFNITNLKSVHNESIQIVKSGMHNKNSGPDFLNAQLKINHQLWIGNVEIHINSSDWYAHKHEEDENYDAVILHIVWNHDAEVFMKNNLPLPTLELKELVHENVMKNYEQLFSKQLQWISCENQIVDVDAFLIKNWLERLYFERLENKSILIKELLANSKNDFEAVLFQLLAKNFGLKVNGDAFLQLAKSFDFSILQKVRFNEFQLSALLFGQAGFFEETVENEYFFSLKNEYDYLKHKYQLTSIHNKQFQFFRMRPNNFPTIRIAQLVALFHKYQNLFSKLLELNRKEDFYDLLSVEVNAFWQAHYTFETTSKKLTKRLTKSFIDLLLINTIIPLKFVYEQYKGILNEEEILKLIQQIKPEKNSIISKFSDLKLIAKNAFESQALLELRNNFCVKKRCINCAIGNNLLKKHI
ncbi:MULTISPECIES: DUF2851 family protein [unclassified Tenacibaculum]|uniref:DUF2851 family protein n=1 Tax=unclassified Tenacibaculum TaxID=2635139 RepID=UPI001F3595AA|nr:MULTISPECIES: DUF2851 family protein [unclassified Tenacibaculum]MCF2876463.1 DUF2851 family protein [Tenacibaculum sp. Cn5-1]MCF2936630.1 DUF2851 family protein [Tenacibaculum sp. Cn5-34]MCG7511777.1 DUF2851 family protein [Tenacibaculum sp. Cn5-46]